MATGTDERQRPRPRLQTHTRADGTTRRLYRGEKKKGNDVVTELRLQVLLEASWGGGPDLCRSGLEKRPKHLRVSSADSSRNHAGLLN